MSGITQAAGAVTASVFALLGGLHVYWAFGGKLGSAVGVPQRGTESTFRPSTTATMAVALLLFLAAAVIVTYIYSTAPGAIRSLAHLGVWILTAVFTLRAIGDLHWFGFLKSVRDTEFATWDTWLYSPLCVCLAVACAAVARSKP